MKKLLFAAALILFVFAGCTSKANKGDEQQIDPATQSEISMLDSISTEIDSIKADIDQSMEEMDEIIDKL